LEPALESSRRLNLQTLYDNLLLGNYALSLCIDSEIIAACVTTVTIDVQGDQACGIIACGGRPGRLWDWVYTWSEISEKLAREAGCKYMFIRGRKGWERFGYEIINYEMKKEI
jgi:hypothetical protein